MLLTFFNSPPPYTMEIKKINVFYARESPKNFYIIYAGESPQPHLVPPTLLIKIKNSINL